VIPVAPEDWFSGDSLELPDYDFLCEAVFYVALEMEARENGASEHVELTGWGEEFVGWSQPPRPADVIVSFDPRASRRDQARAVLYDYYHDDPLRYWSDNEAVKRCFIGGDDPRKEAHDPLLLVAAYENPKHKVWQCQGTGMTWKDLDGAVQQAIAHRKKLGPLPKSSYDTNPIVIYYYDNDKMKRITYPMASVPEALRANNTRWWAWGNGDGSDAGKVAGLDDVHTLETDDSSKIALERSHPGWTKGAKDGKGSAGGWSDEGFQHDKDVAGTGVIGSITGAILALVSAILTATGVGAVVGVPLGIATPFIVAAINATDTALHAGDFGAALANLGPALIQASASALSKSGVNIPPAAVKALGGAVSAISQAVQAGQQKKLDFGQIWNEAAQKAKSYGKLGDVEAEAIARFLSGESPATGHVFIQGFLAGKFLDSQALTAIGKILQAYATFADPRIINLALLGMGMGYISKAQQSGVPVKPSPRARQTPAPVSSAQHAAHGDFVGAFGEDFTGQVVVMDPYEDLEAFVGFLESRYYGSCSSCGGSEVVGFTCPDGYDLVATDRRQIACAYRHKSACLAGRADESGNFVCTEWDYPACPPGMSNVPGSPKNWCFPMTSLPGHVTGQAVPPPPPPIDYGALSRGCPAGSWWDSLSGECRLREPLPPLPHDHGRDHVGFDHFGPDLGLDPWEAARRAGAAAWGSYLELPGPFQYGYKFGQSFF
jgi:hypothetical protein